MDQDIHTKIAQIAAEALTEFGCTLAHIAVAETSTDTVANTSPTAASSGTDMNRMGVFNACAALAEHLIPVFQRLCAEKAAAHTDTQTRLL